MDKVDEEYFDLVRKKLDKYRYRSDKVDPQINFLGSMISGLTLGNSINENKHIRNHVFQNSTSSFNSSDMEILSISIKEIYKLDDFFRYSCIFVSTDEKETLYDIADRVGEYECRRFDLELERILKNNNNKQMYYTREEYYCFNTNEGYIDSFADTLFRISNIYDGKRFELLKPKNSLYICDKRYGSSVDRELRVLETDMVFMIEESKHVSTSSYLKGDLQLACNLIVSHQQNRDKSGGGLVKPLPTVFAIKILATEIILYFMNYDEEYLEYLKNGCKKKEIVMYKLLYNHGAFNMLYERHMKMLLNIISNIGDSVYNLSIKNDFPLWKV